MINAQVTIDSEAISEALEKLIAKGQNMAPVMAEIANLLQTTTEEAFDSETSPIDGTPWESLSPLTIESKTKRGTNNGRILYDQSTMQSSLTNEHSKSSATVGVNAKASGFPYPIVHQFGSKDDKITARPFMPFDQDGELAPQVEDEILELLEEFLFNM